MKFCEVNGHLIHYKFLQEERRRKDVPVLVFLHEGLGSIAQWKDFPSEIAAKVNLPALVYDRYGHGRSDPLTEQRTSQFMWNEGSIELPAILTVLGIDEQLILIGHSDGATIALMFASQFPQNTRAVISEAAHVMLEEKSRQGIRSTVEFYKKGRLHELLFRYHAQLTDAMFSGWAYTWLSEEMNDWNMKDQLMQLNSPVLAIQGCYDEFGSLEQIEYIRKHSGGPVETFIVDNCRHIPHFQQRDKVSGIMTEFINRHILV